MRTHPHSQIWGAGDGNHSGAEKLLISWKAPSPPKPHYRRWGPRFCALCPGSPADPPRGAFCRAQASTPSGGKGFRPTIRRGSGVGQKHQGAPLSPKVPERAGSAYLHVWSELYGAAWRPAGSHPGAQAPEPQPRGHLRGAELLRPPPG